MRLKNKTALITGSAGCIGKATAKRFAEEGATVILSDINEAGCAEVLQEVEAAGGKGSCIVCDVRREDQIISMFEKVKKDFGRLDVLVNIAGGDFESLTGIDDISDEKMSLNLDINLKGTIFCCREASKVMMEQQYGKVINMCSILYRGSPTPMQHTYAAAKGGIYAFTRSLAMTLGFYNINVNGIAPALVEVELLKNTMGAEMWASVKKDCADRYPLGRIGQPIDIANCALFLASKESSFITGQIIEVSGGSRL